jgi:hypothetical protein
MHVRLGYMVSLRVLHASKRMNAMAGWCDVYCRPVSCLARRVLFA